VDNLLFSVINQDDQQVLALLNDDVDMIGDTIDPSFLDTLAAAEDIDIASTLRNGYGYMTINTDKYPLNITSFRRALAFALDKEGISDDVWDGLSSPQDSCVPQINPFSVEGLLPYTYWENNVALGNDLLDDAGFLDIDEDGIREAPDGSEFDILIEVAQSSNIAIEVGQYVADALTSLGVDAESVPTDFYEYLNRLYFHGDFDIVFLGKSVSDFDVDWLAYEYWSEYADEPYWNFPNFRNATYDSWRDQLLHAVAYEDVYEAAIEMQKIWVHACPEIICYENVLLSAYRTDRFEGHVNQVGQGVANWWTYFNVHQATSGGTFRTALPVDVDTFNFMVSGSAYAQQVNMEMWDSLMRLGPNGNDVLWLAESYIAETHDDNPSVTDGHTRFTFDLVQNATWSDGLPLTAEDVAYTLNYYRDSPGNPYGADLTEMTAAYNPTTYSVIVEFSTESFWHLHTICYKPIIPKHVFLSIGLAGWNTWNPNPPSSPMVTSGPYNVSSYSSGDFIELSRNPNYFKGIDISVYETPVIVPENDISYQVGSIDNEISWFVTDTNPDTYCIYNGSDLVASDSWTTGEISIDIDGLDVGTYVFTLYVNDTDGNSATDVVTVTVVDDTTNPITDSPEDLLLVYTQSSGNITWSVYDAYPSYFWIYKDDVVVKSGQWNTSVIYITFDDLEVGIYNYTLVLEDVGENQASDTVFITVTESVAPQFTYIPDDTSFSEGAFEISLMWNFTDENPADYVLYENGTTIDYGPWTSPCSYVYNISAPSYGVYNYTMFVSDTTGLSCTDTLWITIEDTTAPVVNSPDDITIIQGTTGRDLVWTPTDNHPSSFTITRNGTIIMTGTWTSNESLVVDLDGLTTGVFVYTIVLSDQAGNIVTDTVLVHVTEETTTSDTNTSDTGTTTDDPGSILTIASFVITIGSFLVIVVVIILIVRSKR